MPQFDLTRDMTIPYEMLGLEQSLAITPQNTSSPRSAMVSGHLTQALTPHGAEFPMWFTGAEEKVGRNKCLFDRADIRERSVVKKVIPKQFGPNAKANPTTTIICVGVESGEIHTFDINIYTELGRSFGIRNRMINTGLLFPDTPIDRDTEFTEPPNKEDNIYKMGVNGNAMYATLPQTNEDAVLVNKSWAKKLAYTRMKTSTVIIDKNSIPLNLYGDDDTYKIFPDIDEPVRKDGTVVGVRGISPDCFMADLTDNQLQGLQVHDHLVRIDPAARIVDVEVYFGYEFNAECMENPVYRQLMEYYEQSVRYYAAIIDAYCELKAEGYTCSNKMNDLVTRSLAMLGIAIKRKRLDNLGCSHRVMRIVRNMFGKRAGKQTITCFDKKDSVDFAQVVITYAYTEQVGVGSKITNRHGCKGVISEMWDAENMPRDEEGFVADIVICPRAPCNRLDPGQLIEQHIGRTAMVVRRAALEIEDNKEAFKVILEFFHLINPQYAEIVKATVRTDAEISHYLDEIETSGRIHYQIPQFYSTKLIDICSKLRARYKVTKSRVKFKTNIDTPDGSYEEHTTNIPIMIGPAYWFILGKIPKDQANGVEAAWVNQHMLPTKPNSIIKHAQYVTRTPIRYGEDEIAILLMTLPEEVVVRFMCLYGNSPEAFMDLCNTLLTHPNPSQLKHSGYSTEHMINTANNISVFNHMMAASYKQLI